tara:strand:- start:27291 stop:28385 length:1095 start_codon:yes stop_codon:yes gene_type:complete
MKILSKTMRLISRRQRIGRSDHQPVLGLEEFQRLVRRECSLCDRHGLECAVVLFDLAEAPGAGGGAGDTERADLFAMARQQQQQRDGDEIGWAAPGRIGILLPMTGASGAHAVGKRASAPVVETFIYPSGDRKRDHCVRNGRLGRHPARLGQSRSAAVAAGSDMPVWKRAMDIAIASAALVLLAPAMLVIMALIKATSPGPVFFRQRRIGQHGVPFTMLKFRTMVDGADSLKAALQDRNEMSGPLFKIRDDPRITCIGRILRRTSMDELPQLWNVVRGDMSLVGPRPATPEEVALYEPWQQRRLSVKQGLTGYWQIEGRGQVGFPQSVRMDLRYAAAKTEPSPMTDLAILARTVRAVLSGRGAS